MVALFASTVASYDITLMKAGGTVASKGAHSRTGSCSTLWAFRGPPSRCKGGHVKPCRLCKWVNPACLTGLESTCPAYRHRDQIMFSNTAKSNKTPQPNSTAGLIKRFLVRRAACRGLESWSSPPPCVCACVTASSGHSSQTTQVTFLKCTTECFKIYSQLCSHHYRQF